MSTVSDFLEHHRSRSMEGRHDASIELFQSHEGIQADLREATAKALPLLRLSVGKDGSVKLAIVGAWMDEAKEVSALIDQHEGRLISVRGLIEDFLTISGGEFELNRLQTQMENCAGQTRMASQAVQAERVKFGRRNPHASLADMAGDPDVAYAEDRLAEALKTIEPELEAMRGKMARLNAIIDEANGLRGD